MAPEEHNEGHVTETTVTHQIHTQVKKKENLNEIVLNIDQMRIDNSSGKVVLCQGSSSCSDSLRLEPKSAEAEPSNNELEMVSCDKNNNAISEKSSSCSIEVKGVTAAEDSEGERVCRICHLSHEHSFGTEATSEAAATSGLIKLGCGCKDELGIAHIVCAEAWFRLKGNRLCEICGETANNITGIWDDRFIEKMWNERLSNATTAASNFGSSSQREGCWRGQPFCNFLMACLVIAFVLPWFFRVSMF